MRAKEVLRTALRAVLAAAMVGVGVMHFVGPAPFIRIVPAWLPAPALLVALSGVAEIALGLGLLVPRSAPGGHVVRKWTGYGLIALYVAVFPANVNMAIHQIQLNPGDHLPVWAMWARLPFQLAFIAIAWWVTRAKGEGEAKGKTDASVEE